MIDTFFYVLSGTLRVTRRTFRPREGQIALTKRNVAMGRYGGGGTKSISCCAFNTF